MIKLKQILSPKPLVNEGKITVSINNKPVKFTAMPINDGGFAFIGPDLTDSPEITKALKSHCESKLGVDCDRDNSYKGAGIAFKINIYNLLKKL